jgi:hypothetical protein
MNGQDIEVEVNWEDYYHELEIIFITGVNRDFRVTISRDHRGTSFYSAFLSCVISHRVDSIIGAQYIDEVFQDLLSMTDQAMIDAYLATVTETIKSNLCYTEINACMYGPLKICLRVVGGKK